MDLTATMIMATVDTAMAIHMRTKNTEKAPVVDTTMITVKTMLKSPQSKTLTTRIPFPP